MPEHHRPEITRDSAISSGRSRFRYGADVGPVSDKHAARQSNRGEWLVNVTDEVVVPMTTLEVVDALRSRRLSEQSLVWRIGMHDWTAVLDVPQLRLAASSRPPPPFQETFAQATAELSLAAVPSTLAPTTVEAEALAPARASGSWSGRELEQLLSDERRADQKSSRRVVLGATLGSAVLAAAFILALLRWPGREEAGLPTQGARPSEAAPSMPLPAQPPTPEALPAPSARAIEHAAAAASSRPQSIPSRSSRRPKRPAPSASASSTPWSAATPDTTGSTPSVAVVPAAPVDPTPPASAPVEAAPASSALALPLKRDRVSAEPSAQP